MAGVGGGGQGHFLLEHLDVVGELVVDAEVLEQGLCILGDFHLVDVDLGLVGNEVESALSLLFLHLGLSGVVVP